MYLNTQFLQFFQIRNQAIILEAQGMFVFPTAIAVALTAGLRAATAVTTATADGSRQIALTGITHAQCAMSKDFNFDRGIAADIADFLHAQFPAQNHTGQSPGSAKQHAGQRVHGHLGRTVDGNLRRDLTAHLYNAQILNNEGIYTAGGSVTDQVSQFGHFLVRDQCI
jgi:hypothetical protein